MTRTLYDHGQPFTKDLADVLDSLIRRVELNKASLLIIDGAIGEGKTTLGVHCADYINKKYNLPPIDFEDQLGRGGSAVLKLLRVCFNKKLPVCIYDESGDFNRRGALTAFNQMLNRTFETFRAFKIIVILILPSFNVLDNDLFDKQIPRCLIHCYDRRQNYGKYKVYSLYRMYYIKNKMDKLTVKPHAYGMVDPNQHGYFLNLPTARCSELDMISTKGKLSILKKAEIKIDGLISYSEIAQKLNRSLGNVSLTMNKLKLKPTRVIDKVKYFDNSVIDILYNYFDSPTTRKKPPKNG
jgi:hypothetical protein